MNTISCKCKKSAKTFFHIKPQDMPEGWEGECCLEALAAPVVEDAPKEEPAKSKKKQKKEQSL